MAKFRDSRTDDCMTGDHTKGGRYTTYWIIRKVYTVFTNMSGYCHQRILIIIVVVLRWGNKLRVLDQSSKMCDMWPKMRHAAVSGRQAPVQIFYRLITTICGYKLKAVIILLWPLQEVKLLYISLDFRSKGGGLKSFDTI